MSDEKRFSVSRGLEGCLVSLLVNAGVMVLISLVLNRLLGLISNETERVVGLVVWLACVCLGGYCAARRGKTTGWTNALVVGVIAEWFAAVRLLKGTSLLELMDDPGPNWRRLAVLAVTIPVACLGGYIWVAQSKKSSVADQHSPKSSPTEPPANV